MKMCRHFDLVASFGFSSKLRNMGIFSYFFFQSPSQGDFPIMRVLDPEKDLPDFVTVKRPIYMISLG